MSKMVVGFVGGDTDLDKFIEKFSHGEDVDVSHAFLMLFGSTYESTGAKEEQDPYPGVWLHNPDKFIDDQHAKFIEVEVPNKRAGEDKARELLGTLYGYTDCLETGLKELFNISIPDNELSMHCSETVTRILRAAGIDILPNIEAGQVSPAALYKEVMQLGGQDIAGQLCSCG